MATRRDVRIIKKFVNFRTLGTWTSEVKHKHQISGFLPAVLNYEHIIMVKLKTVRKLRSKHLNLSY
jgi:hypothetical protein